MKRSILSLFVFASTITSVNAQSINDVIESNPYTVNCMASRKCREGVKKINNISDISKFYPDGNFNNIANEFNKMISTLKKIGVEVFLGDKKYFPTNYRGIYSTRRNNFYLNEAYANNSISLIRTMRHEGWHVAQDCKAGIDNMELELIMSDEIIPQPFTDFVEETYADEPRQIPYEKGAFFASFSKGLTQTALEECARTLR